MSLHYSVEPPLVYRRLPKHLPYSLGFSKYCLGFDGAATYISLGVDTFTYAQMRRATMELWFKPNTLAPALQYLIDLEGAIVLRLQGATLMFYNDGSGAGPNYVVPQTGRWYHVVAKWNDVTTRLLINGVEVSNVLATTFDIDTLNREQTVGGGYTHVAYLNGFIDEPRFYNRELTNAEVHYNMLNYHQPIRNGLILLLRLDEGVGLTAFDESGLGNNGSLLPVITPPTWNRLKKWELRASVNL